MIVSNTTASIFAGVFSFLFSSSFFSLKSEAAKSGGNLGIVIPKFYSIPRKQLPLYVIKSLNHTHFCICFKFFHAFFPREGEISVISRSGVTDYNPLYSLIHKYPHLTKALPNFCVSEFHYTLFLLRVSFSRVTNYAANQTFPTEFHLF